MNMFPWEWDRLPWWTQQIYSEGLMHEKPWVSMPMLQEPFDPFDPRYGAFTSSESGSTYEDSLHGLAEWGFNIASA